jgi:hypothetical protein
MHSWERGDWEAALPVNGRLGLSSDSGSILQTNEVNACPDNRLSLLFWAYAFTIVNHIVSTFLLPTLCETRNECARNKNSLKIMNCFADSGGATGS